MDYLTRLASRHKTEKLKGQRGDTLVEVLLAVGILSVVIVSATIMMNRGLQSAQAALEHSQVRAWVTAQAELLQYARDSYVAAPPSSRGGYPASLWPQILSYQNSAGGDNCQPGGNPFYLTFDPAAPSDQQVQVKAFNPVTGSKPVSIASPGDGLWIEAVAGTSTSIGYTDFFIRACWSPVSSSGPMQESKTVVRLYNAQP
ncbi:MAG: type II secretion system protein [Candidatus Chaera renei]|uniref:Type II secretion system protein n=1 Tax=Candidatus Chaera renei TaxID=2506947 RepID=A0A4Q0AJC8_9BACT|nr:MAG: type II secretion system protein [Candidatus Chaera renei]